MKYKELLANTVAFTSCRHRLIRVLAGAAKGEKEVRVVWGTQSKSTADENTVLAESFLYLMFSPGLSLLRQSLHFLHSNIIDVYLFSVKHN